MKVTDKFIFFWTGKDVYSNFYYSPFKHQGILFKWSEQAVMWRKAKLFGADKIAEKILKAQTPKECKDLGRSREIAFDEGVWLSHREEVYWDVLYDKFSTPKLKQQILSTGDKILAEASPYDKIWGIGLSESDKRAENPSEWLGENLLGQVLMRVREDLRKFQGDK